LPTRRIEPSTRTARREGAFSVIPVYTGDLVISTDTPAATVSGQPLSDTRERMAAMGYDAPLLSRVDDFFD